MTPRENYLNFFRNKPYEWVPRNEDIQPVFPSVICENVARATIMEGKPFPPERFGGIGWFGIEWVYVPMVGGSMEKEGTQLFEDFNDWEKYVKFPDLDEIDWEGYAKDHYDYLNTDKINMGSVFTGFFERMISFAGFENAAMALLDEDQEDAVHALLDKLADFYIDYIGRMNKYWNVEYFEVHDDWGNQRSLMFSIDTHREMILPHVKKVVDAVHALGCPYEQHSCGAISDLIPNLIESGADSWMGQTTAIDRKALIDKYESEYGDRLKFRVQVFMDGNGSDEDCLAAADKFVEDYSGKRVHYWLKAIGASPEKLKLFYDRVKRDFVIPAGNQ